MNDVKKFPMRRELIGGAVALVMLLVLVALGTWQLQRATWKKQVLAHYNAQVNREPLIALPPRDRAPHAVYSRAALGGKFAHQHSIAVRPRHVDGKSGYDLITPLVLYTGEVILVLRGFVPDATKESLDQPTGTVAVTGLLRAFSARDWHPRNDPDKDQWYWIDPDALARKYSYADIYPLLMVADVKPLNTPWPSPQAYAPAFRDAHYIYAFIWFSLAIALVVIYVRMHTRKPGPRKDDTLSQHAPDVPAAKRDDADDSTGSGGTGIDPSR